MKRGAGLPISCLFLVPLMSGVLLLGRLPCALLEPEEARYAEIPRQMLATNHFLTPVLHGQAYYQKPPLLYWLVMASYRVFGVHDWAARLVPCGAALGIVALTWLWAQRRSGARAGWLSGVVLCLSPAFIYRGPLLSMDTLLALCVLAALMAAEEALRGAALSHHGWLLAGSACGLGVLTKGPVALLLMIVPILGVRLFNASAPKVSARAWVGFLGVVVAVAGPWFAVVAARDPEAFLAFLWLHNVQRFLAPFDHVKPIWYFLPELFAGTLPWSLWLIPLLRERLLSRLRISDCRLRIDQHDPTICDRQSAIGNPRSHSRLLPLALLWCVLFFSLSGCKRPAYILPAMPLLAIELGSYLARRPSWPRVLPAVGGAMSALLLVGVFWYLPAYHAKFSLREQVVRQRALADTLPVACYPRRWDSVSFYLARQLVRPYSRPEKADLCHDLENHGACLLFVKAAFLDELRASLPGTVEFQERDLPNSYVIPGVLRKR